MATAQITIPANVAAALEPLEGALVADSVAFEQVLRWAVHQVGEELCGLSEGAEPREIPQGLRPLAARLEVLADAYEAVA